MGKDNWGIIPSGEMCVTCWMLRVEMMMLDWSRGYLAWLVERPEMVDKT